MTETIEVDIGNLYGNLHHQYGTQLGEDYDEGLRQAVENYLHSLNQQMERQAEGNVGPTEVADGGSLHGLNADPHTSSETVERE